MDNVIDLAKKVTVNFKDRDKDHVEDFFTLYTMINPESVDVLEKEKITLTRNSQVIVLTQDPKTLVQTLDLAGKMGFTDAYRENPLRLRTLVADVIKRMAKCDAIGVPYKTDKGYANFLFSSRLFKQMTDTLTEEQKKIIATPVEEKEETEAKPIIEAIITKFDFTDNDVKNIYQKLEEVEKKKDGASVKDIIMETLQATCSVDKSFLEKVIDDTIKEYQNEEDVLQRRVA